MGTVGVLGAGSWGTALGVHLARVGHDVRLWARDPALVNDMRERRANAIYLEDVTLPETLTVTDDIRDAVAGSDLLVSAIPSRGCRAVIQAAAPHVAPDATLVSATKGLETGTWLRMSEVIAQELGPGRPVVVLSGPSFASEVAQQLPTAVLAASLDAEATEFVQTEFRGPAVRLYGSADLFSDAREDAYRPQQSVNFVTCHDGFTLNDLVSYNQKHNEPNGEDNRDGANDNRSSDWGVEGPTDDPAIEKLRSRHAKNLLTVTLLSLGLPMILMGDEVRRTQYGNNNAYCHNNELSWFDWSLLKKHSDVYRFVKHLIYARLQRDVSKPEYSMSLNQLLQKRLVNWHGVKLNQPDWSNHSHSIAFTIESLSKDVMWHYMVNAYHEALEFELPQVKDASHWKRWIDTSLASPDDICYQSDASITASGKYLVQPRSTVVLIARL